MQYKAFLSYSHAADGKLAPALQSSLQQFARKWNQLRAARVFRDKTGLSANPGLWSAIEAALNESEYFLLLASPGASESIWVTREVNHSLEHSTANRMLLVLTSGEIVWDSLAGDFDWSLTTALPAILKGKFTQEPLYIDLRWAASEEHVSVRNPAFRDAVADLASALHGISKDQLIGEDVRQHKRLVLLRRSAIAALTILALGLGVTAVLATRERDLARRQAEVALARQLAAESEAMRVQKASSLPRSLLLALESMKRYPTVEGDEALGNGLALLPRLLGEATHKETIVQVAFNADRSRVATASWDGNVGLWALPGLKPVATLPQGGRATAIAFSPDGNTLATGGWGGTARLWDSKSGAPRSEPLPAGGQVMTVDFSPDGKMLAATVQAGNGASLMVWDVASGAVLQKLATSNLGSSNARGVAFDKNGNVAVPSRAAVRFWDLQSWQEQTPLPNGLGEVLKVAFSPDDKVLAAAANNNIRLFNVPDHVSVAELHVDFVLSDIAFSPDATMFAASSSTGAVRVWGVEKWNELMNVRQELGITAVSFSPDSTLLGTSSLDGSATVWDVVSGRKVGQAVHDDGLTNLAFSPGGEFLVTASKNGTARLWDVAGSPEVAKLIHGDIVESIRFSPRDESFASLDNDRLVGIWSSESKRIRYQKKDESAGSIILSPNGVFAARSLAGDSIFVSNLVSGQEVATLTDEKPVNLDDIRKVLEARGLGYRAVIPAIAEYKQRGTITLQSFDAEGGRLIALRADGRIRVWDIARKKILIDESYADQIEHPAFMGSRYAGWIRDKKILEVYDLRTGTRAWTNSADVEFIDLISSLNGQYVAAVARQEALGHAVTSVWDSSSGKKMFDVKTTSYENALSLSPDGRFFAVTGEDKKLLHVWDVPGRWELFRAAQTELVTSIAFSRTGTLLAIGDDHGGVQVWNLENRQNVYRLRLPDPVTTLTFVPDSSQLAIASGSFVHFFEMAKGREMARLTHAGVVQQITFSPTGKYIGTASQASPTAPPTARVWLWRSGDLISAACLHVFRNLDQGEWKQFLPDQQFRETCPHVAR